MLDGNLKKQVIMLCIAFLVLGFLVGYSLNNPSANEYLNNKRDFKVDTLVNGNTTEYSVHQIIQSNE